jgi:hypothetical protein
MSDVKRSLFPLVRRSRLREALARAEQAEARIAGIDAIVERERNELSEKQMRKLEYGRLGYTEEEWAALVEQIDRSDETHGVSRTGDDLKRVVREHRRATWGTLNAIALVRYIESLEAQVSGRV